MLVGLAAARGGEWGVGGGGEVVRSSAEVGGLGRSLDVTLGKSFHLSGSLCSLIKQGTAPCQLSAQGALWVQGR